MNIPVYSIIGKVLKCSRNCTNIKPEINGSFHRYERMTLRLVYVVSPDSMLTSISESTVGTGTKMTAVRIKLRQKIFLNFNLEILTVISLTQRSWLDMPGRRRYKRCKKTNTLKDISQLVVGKACMIEDIFPKGRGGGSEIYNFPEGVEGILRPTKLWQVSSYTAHTLLHGQETMPATLVLLLQLL